MLVRIKNRRQKSGQTGSVVVHWQIKATSQYKLLHQNTLYQLTLIALYLLCIEIFHLEYIALRLPQIFRTLENFCKT